MNRAGIVKTVLLIAVLVVILLPCTYPASASDNFVLSDDTAIDDEETIDLTNAGIVKGHLTIREYQAIVGTVTFTLIGSIEEYTVDVPEEANGEYQIVLPVGQYSARAMANKTNEISTLDDEKFSSSIVTVEAGTVISDADFEFNDTYTLVGVVRYGDMVLSGVTVSLYKPDIPRSVVETNSEGRFEFKGLEGGEWTILFEKEGFVTVSRQIDMDETAYFNLQMLKSGLPGINGFIAGYDFQHSMMILGLIGMISVIVLSLILRLHVLKNPRLVLEDEYSEEDQSEEH